MLLQETISDIADLIEIRSKETGNHAKNTQYYMKLLVGELRKRGLYPNILTEEYANLCVETACLHDLGKIVIPDEILNAPRKLTDDEYVLMQQHTIMGERMISVILGGEVNKAYLQLAKQMIIGHHEWWDGTGYPNNLAGAEIPLCARLMAIVDVYDALISKRCYKEALPPKEALKTIVENSGKQFEPILVEVFVDIFRRHLSY